MQRSGRRGKILDIIKLKQVETQEELAAELFAEGFRVTQATVSRDIKELGLIKIGSPTGKQYYAKETGARNDTGKIADVAFPAITGCVLAERLVVIKTLNGFGRVVKQAVANLSENLGLVADDDTVFVAFSDNITAVAFYKKLNAIIY